MSRSYLPDQRLDASVAELRRILVEHRRGRANFDPSLPPWNQPVTPLRRIGLTALNDKPPTRWEAHLELAKEDP